MIGMNATPSFKYICMCLRGVTDHPNQVCGCLGRERLLGLQNYAGKYLVEGESQPSIDESVPSFVDAQYVE